MRKSLSLAMAVCLLSATSHESHAGRKQGGPAPICENGGRAANRNSPESLQTCRDLQRSVQAAVNEASRNRAAIMRAAESVLRGTRGALGRWAAAFRKRTCLGLSRRRWLCTRLVHVFHRQRDDWAVPSA